jgi:hypothetical protein
VKQSINKKAKGQGGDNESSKFKVQSANVVKNVGGLCGFIGVNPRLL